MYFLIYYTCFHIASVLAASDTRHLYHADQSKGLSHDVDFVLLSDAVQEGTKDLNYNLLESPAAPLTNEYSRRLKRSNNNNYQEGSENVTVISHIDHSNGTTHLQNISTISSKPILLVPDVVPKKVPEITANKSNIASGVTVAPVVAVSNVTVNNVLLVPDSILKKVPEITANKSNIASGVTVAPVVAVSNVTINNGTTAGNNVTSINKNITIISNHNNSSIRGYNESAAIKVESVTTQDNITIPDYTVDLNEKDLEFHNISKRYEDNHIYYNSTRIYTPDIVKRYWVDTSPTTFYTNPLLSHSYRRASTVILPFKFSFYGHEIDNITVATGGFIYTGDFVHSWLAATQYIAPLMANFDTSITNYSSIKYGGNETAFTIVWENVVLQDKPTAGNFTFQMTLLNTGDIMFVYKDVPYLTNNITDDFHPVKVGLSDAYILDRTIFYVRRKTIFEYHRIHFDKNDLKNWTLIYLKPQKMCLNRTTCESCLTGDTIFKCQWCDNRCSTGIDRFRHDWMKKDCDKRKISEIKQCNAPLEKVPIPGAHNAVNELVDRSGTKSSLGTVFLMVLLLGLISSLILWTFYAYKNPHSTSGQILIKYRPSQWSSWRKGEARYTAATIHM